MPAEHGSPEPALLPSLSMDMGATVQEEEESEEDGHDRGHGHTVPFYCGSRSHPYGHPQEGGNSRRAPLFFFNNVEKNMDTLLLHSCAPKQYKKRTKKDKGRETTSTPSVQPSRSHAQRNGRTFY
mmetsp:Transcript_47475/g.92708  ORF Transcript_47475/g.92708 Transcript_47475/m.92708 type:complete len:125 (-) Transcript_47475:657-1031(-)